MREGLSQNEKNVTKKGCVANGGSSCTDGVQKGVTSQEGRGTGITNSVFGG